MGQGADFVRAVVLTGDQQGSDLHVALLRRQGDGALHRVQVAAQAAVPFWGEAFEVDIGRVKIREERPPGLFLDSTVGNQHVDHAPVMDSGGAVPDVLVAHQRLVVGVGHANVSPGDQLRRLVRQPLRGHVHGLDCAVPSHGDLMVLAEGTAEVAAEAAHR